MSLDRGISEFKGEISLKENTTLDSFCVLVLRAASGTTASKIIRWLGASSKVPLPSPYALFLSLVTIAMLLP